MEPREPHGRRAAVTPVLHDRTEAVAHFLYHEAQLLEEARFEEWLALFADDARYVMPVRQTVQPRAGGPARPGRMRFALYDDDKASLTLRVRRLATGKAHAEVPYSVTQRLITNVVVEPGEDGTLIAHSRFLVYQEHRGRHGTTFVGKRRDLLRCADGDFAIAERHIELAQSVLPRAVSIFF